VEYQIEVKGHLSHIHTTWLDDFTITHKADGNTVLIGIVQDQAALYGVLARLRDLGVTLISVQRSQPYSKEDNRMSKIYASASRVINAKPEALYAVIADYKVGHPAILPKPYFTGLEVEKGGVGEGTLMRTKMKVFGREYEYHHLASEPEPGRVLVETDINTGQFSRFTVDPISPTQTRVTIEAVTPASPGFAGVMEKLVQPIISRRIFKQELQNLAEYVTNKA
jgi:hypothetical protein